MSNKVYYDRQRRSCITLKRDSKSVSFIRLQSNGLNIEQLPTNEFDKEYKEVQGYSIADAAKIYINYARVIGASKEALDFLTLHYKASKEELKMAQAKTPTEKPVEKKVTKRQAAAATKKLVDKAVKDELHKAKNAANKAVGRPTEKKPSAASMFKDLIMEGKKTDDEIFAAVQKEFDLPANKRSYVNWYRNDLTKKGMNPPAPVTK